MYASLNRNPNVLDFYRGYSPVVPRSKSLRHSSVLLSPVRPPARAYHELEPPTPLNP